MNSSNGNFLDENGNPVNIVQLLKTGKAVPVESPGHGLHMAAHSGWFTDENGIPVNIIALIDAAIDEGGGSDKPAIGGISVNGGTVVTPDENGIINLTISGDGSTVIDSELSKSSTNPVQNKVVTGEIEDLNEAVDSLNGSLGTFLNTVPVDTASGSIASFSDGADNVPVKSLTVKIDPVQSGSGDPSPDNIRPISGWIGATLTCNNETINIDWTSEAGTVYGGSLDVSTGVLTVTHAIKSFTRGINSHSQIPNRFYINSAFSDCGEGTPLCNMFSYANKAFSKLSNGEFGIDTNYTRLYFGASAFSDATEANAFFAENPLIVAYPLAIPVTHQLTPQEIKTILGENNIFADTGDVSVEYRADIKKYIDKVVATAVSALS